MMPKPLSGLEDIRDRYTIFIVDLWGVIHDGTALYEGVIEALCTLRDEGKRIFFLSNSPRRAEQVKQQLEALGLPRDLYEDIHTSGEDAYLTLKERTSPWSQSLGFKAYGLTASFHRALVEDLKLTRVGDLAEADFILNTGPEHLHVEDYEDLLEEAAHFKLPMVCVNPDVSIVSGGRVILCAGALAERYEALGGKVYYLGKPYAQIYETLFTRMKGVDPAHILVIGDSLTTDIKGANLMGLDSALVLTGLTSLLEGSKIEAVYAECKRLDIYPTYLLPGFEL